MTLKQILSCWFTRDHEYPRSRSESGEAIPNWTPERARRYERQNLEAEGRAGHHYEWSRKYRRRTITKVTKFERTA